MTDKVRKDLARIIETQRQLKDAELLRSKPFNQENLDAELEKYKGKMLGKMADKLNSGFD